MQMFDRQKGKLTASEINELIVLGKLDGIDHLMDKFEARLAIDLKTTTVKKY